MKTAMTVEMWMDYLGDKRRVEITDPNGDVQVLIRGDKKETPEGGIHHALAAVALHGKAFGFTWDDIVTLDSCLPSTDPDRLDSLKDRIAALLNPVTAGAEVSA